MNVEVFKIHKLRKVADSCSILLRWFGANELHGVRPLVKCERTLRQNVRHLLFRARTTNGHGKVQIHSVT